MRASEVIARVAADRVRAEKARQHGGGSIRRGIAANREAYVAEVRREDERWSS